MARIIFDKNYAATPVTSPDYLKIAEAYGLRGYRAFNENDLSKVLDEIMVDDEPAIVECVVTKEDNVFPMVPSGKPLNETITE